MMDQSPSYGHHNACLFKWVTGIPCPGCGMGRATIALVSGDLASSLHYNMLCIPFTLAILTIVIWMITDLFRHQETIYPYLTRRASTPVTIILFALLAVNWMLNIAHHV